MHILRIAVVAAISAIPVSHVASAADMPVKAPVATVAAPVHNWTGFYVGANAGYAWGNSDASSTTTCLATTPPGWSCTPSNPASLVNGPFTDALGTGSLNPKGFAGGVQAGYNFQNSNFVYGLEVDFGALNLRASRSGSGIMPHFAIGLTTVGSSIETDWLFTARGRLGWSLSNVLVYATGGLATTNLKTGNSYRDSFANPGFESSSSSRVKTGWTLGGGIEWAMTPNWSVRGEYLYVDFGSITTSGNIGTSIVTVPLVAQPLSTSTDLKVNIARVGINYKFN